MNRCLLALLLTSSVLLGQQNLTEIPPQDPAIEQASFKVAKGFEVNLWAADPLLAKPTQISFDHEGRLWVASSETYPQLNVNQEPNDRILILEDTDQDGKADKHMKGDGTYYLVNTIFHHSFLQYVGFIF